MQLCGMQEVPLLLASVFQVTNSLAVCATGLCFQNVFGDCVV